MRIAAEQWNGWTVLGIEGNFTLRCFASVRPTLQALWETRGIKIALDLSKTKLVDSSAITLLLNLRERVKKSDGTLVMFGLNEDMRLVFSIIEFGKSVPLYGTRAEFEQVAAG